MWICARCETKNEDEGMYCAVCGMKRGTESQLPKTEENLVAPPHSVGDEENNNISLQNVVPVVPVTIIEDKHISEKKDKNLKEIIGWLVLLTVLIVWGFLAFPDIGIESTGKETSSNSSITGYSESEFVTPLVVKTGAPIKSTLEINEGTETSSPTVNALIYADLPEEATDIEWKILKNGTTPNVVYRVYKDEYIVNGVDCYIQKDKVLPCEEDSLKLYIYQHSPDDSNEELKEYIYDGSVKEYCCAIELSYIYDGQPYVSTYSLYQNLFNHGYNAVNKFEDQEEDTSEQSIVQPTASEFLTQSSSAPISSSTKQTEKCSHKDTSCDRIDIEYNELNDTYHEVQEEYEIICENCGEIVDTDTESFTEDHTLNSDSKCTACGYQGVVECKHENTVDKEGTREEFENGEWSQKVELVCENCKEVLDSWYRRGENIDIMIPAPDDNNEIEIDNNGEAATPVS